MLRDRARNVDEHAAEALAEEVRQFAHPLNTKEDLEPLIERMGDARYTDMARAGMLNIVNWRASNCRMRVSC